MRLKIFACHHLLPQKTCNTDIFQTFVSNKPEPEDNSFITDLNAINIADNNLYSEMRQQFYVWKNLIDDYDHIGFEHYRRLFFIDPMPVLDAITKFPVVAHMRAQLFANSSHGVMVNSVQFDQYVEMRQSLEAGVVRQLKEYICRYDIVVPRPIYGCIESHWKQDFPDPHFWDTMMEAMAKSRFFKRCISRVTSPPKIFYYANIYIMRSDLLGEYLDFCFEALDYIRDRLTLADRGLGYFSERLFAFWLYRKRIESPTLHVLELPWVFHNTALD